MSIPSSSLPLSNRRTRLPRVVFVIGPTSSGKTSLGVTIARTYKGEIINADARQIYRQVHIGTGKPIGESKLYQRRHRAFIHQDIPHYLMDFLPPSENYSAVEWRDAAMKAIQGIRKRKHLPVIVGGTGLYISSIVNNLEFPDVPPQPVLRAAYESKPLEDLVHLLLRIDPDAEVEVDLRNKRRVIRAIEMMTFTGQKMAELRKKGPPLVDALQIGIERSREDLYARADAEIERMFERGLVEEVNYLLKQGVSESSPAFTSLGYREIVAYLRNELTREEAMDRMKKITHAYIRRQVTWFKRDPRIIWVKSEKEGIKEVEKWLKKKGA
jgi:tRNA dimethylallyltransferase